MSAWREQCTGVVPLLNGLSEAISAWTQGDQSSSVVAQRFATATDNLADYLGYFGSIITPILGEQLLHQYWLDAAPGVISEMDPAMQPLAMGLLLNSLSRAAGEELLDRLDDRLKQAWLQHGSRRFVEFDNELVRLISGESPPKLELV